MLPIDYGPSTDPHDGLGLPLAETVWVEPYPDETMGVEDGLASPEPASSGARASSSRSSRRCSSCPPPSARC